MNIRKNQVFALLFLAASWGSSAQAQMYFDSEAVFLGRNNTGGASFLSGANGLSTSQGKYDVVPGYRLGFGVIGEEYQVDLLFTQISPWTSDYSSTFGGNVYFDNDSTLAANESTLVFPGFLREAARSGLAGFDESTEAEFLDSTLPNAPIFTTSTKTNYRDFEVDVGTSQFKRPWRIGVGYRNIHLDEKNLTGLSGDFNVKASTSGGTPNNGLSDTALTNAGATLISGTGDGFDSTGSGLGTDFLNYQVYGTALNELNGAQVLFAWKFYDGSWFSLESYSKAGIFHNNVSGRVQETLAGSGNDNSVYQRNFTSKDSGAAFAGNLGLRAVIGLTDYIDLVGGYEVLFLSGVALGPDQISGVITNNGATTYQVQHDGSLIANGGTIGLRIYW